MQPIFSMRPMQLSRLLKRVQQEEYLAFTNPPQPNPPIFRSQVFTASFPLFFLTYCVIHLALSA